MRHCQPSCRSCEAAERIGKLVLIAEELGDTALADALLDLSDRAGRKDPIGARLVAAILDPTSP